MQVAHTTHLFILDSREDEIIKMSKQKSILIIIIFTILIGSAYIIWPFVCVRLEGENTENRNLAEMPKFSLETVSEYPRQMESFIDDHLPFRSKMIELNSVISYYLMGTSASERVETGKDGWLFYKDESSMDYYTGRKLYTEEQLRTIANNMQITKDNLEKQGVKFALFIAPNKERVYPEKMPSYYGKPSGNNALRQVVDYLRDNTDVTVVCPYDSLMKAKEENPDMILYHKTDTHWNDLGAYIGACDLFDALGIEWDRSSISVNEVNDVPGDMAKMLNLDNVIEAGEAYQLTGLQHNDARSNLNTDSDYFGHWIYETPIATNGSIIVRRDSFCTPMRLYIAEAFKNSDMVHLKSFTNALIEQKKPDYFVYQFTERHLDQLLTYSYNNLSYELNFSNYLDKLLEDKERYTIFISAMDEATSALTSELIQKLKALGVKADLSDKHCENFYSVINGGNNVAEDLSTEKVAKESSLENGLHYAIVSAGHDTGDISSICINGVEYSKAKSGLNFVVYDNEYNVVIDSVNFDIFGSAFKATR